MASNFKILLYVNGEHISRHSYEVRVPEAAGNCEKGRDGEKCSVTIVYLVEKPEGGARTRDDS